MSAADASSEIRAGWWEAVTATALVGTARRGVPEPPSGLGGGRPGASREVSLLDAVALGAVLLRAGAPPSRPEVAAAAPEEVLPSSPPRETQLLELVLRQPPVGAALADRLLAAWLAGAAAAGVRAPAGALTELLDRASRTPQLRDQVRTVVGTRGAWLGAANPQWSWVVASPRSDAASDPPTAGTPETPDPAAWARSATPGRVAAVTRLRATRPDAARALVTSTWPTEGAGDRAALLAALGTGLGPADEPFLESALDDRAAGVREAAAGLLDALPESRRAARMADRLRALVTVSGRLRRALQVELPGPPDPAAVRDGLGPRRGVGSQRGHALERIAAGAPLEVWTQLSRTTPDATWRMLTDRDARAGVLRAVLTRRDPAWAAALIGDVWHPGLLALLPPAAADAAAVAHLGRATTPQQHAAVLAALPAGWGREVSLTVVRRLRDDAHLVRALPLVADRLAAGLHPDAVPGFRDWADSAPARGDDAVRRAVQHTVQYLTLLPAIAEAFR